jgi:hypothetical protein
MHFYLFYRFWIFGGCGDRCMVSMRGVMNWAVDICKGAAVLNLFELHHLYLIKELCV